MVDRAGTESEAPFADFAFDPGPEVATLDRSMEDDRPAACFDGSEDRISIRNLRVHHHAEDGGRRELPENRHEPLGRIDATALRRSGELRRITEQQGSLRIEQGHLGDRMTELVEPRGTIEDLDVELRWPRAVAPHTHRAIHEEPLLTVDQTSAGSSGYRSPSMQYRKRAHGVSWRPAGPPE